MNPPDMQPTYDLVEYRESGIREHPGVIPIWLLLVYVALLGWGVYYLLTFLPSHFAG